MDYTQGGNSFATGIHQTAFHRADWSSFVAMLESHRRILRRACKYVKLTQTPWVAPFALRDGVQHRTRDCLLTSTDWIAIDLDLPGWTIDRLDARLDGWRRIYYTTTHSRHARQRWRVIMECDRYHTLAEHEAIWRGMNAALYGEVDPSTLDATRLHYVPACWTGADNLWAVYSGGPLPVDGMIELAPPPAPEPKAMIEVDLANAPDGTDIIPDWMIEREFGSPVGGRLYRIMVGAACRYQRNGWYLGEDDLAAAALVASQIISPGKRRAGLLREAQNAIGYAATRIEPLSPLERYRAGLYFALSHSR